MSSKASKKGKASFKHLDDAMSWRRKSLEAEAERMDACFRQNEKKCLITGLCGKMVHTTDK